MHDDARAGGGPDARESILFRPLDSVRRLSRQGGPDVLQLPGSGRRGARDRRRTGRRWHPGHWVDLSLRYADRAFLQHAADAGAIMTQPFVSQLRARTSTIRLLPQGAQGITIRVEMPEVWDTVRIVTA